MAGRVGSPGGGSEISPRAWAHWAALGAIVVVGAVVRIAYMGEPMRYDEAFTFTHYASAPIKTGLSTYDFPNNHLLHTALVHASWRVFGDETWSVRLPALLAGIAVVPAVYVAASSFYDRASGLAASALAAGSAPLVTYSAQARGYSIVVLCGVLALALAPRLVARGSILLWSAFTVLGICAIYAIPSGAYAIAVPVVWIALTCLLPRGPWRDRAERARRLRTLGSLAAAGAITALVSAALYLPTRGETGWTYAEEADRTFGSLADVARTVIRQWRDDVPTAIAVLVALSALAAIVFNGRVGRWPVAPAVAALGTLVVIALVGPISPFARTWLYLLPILLITAGAGLGLAITTAGARLRTSAEPLAAGAAAALAIVLGLLVSPGAASEEDPPRGDDAIVSYLRGHLRSGEGVISEQIAATPLEYYFRRERFGPLFPGVTPAQQRAGRAVVVVPGKDGAVAAQVVAAGGGHPAGPPRLAKQFRYISVWDVPLS